MKCIHCIFLWNYVVYRLHVLIARKIIASCLDYLHESFLTFSISFFTDSITERETIKKFLNAKKCMVITYDQEETIPSVELGMDIEVVPVYKFLLVEHR